jgi:hypothetical protein
VQDELERLVGGRLRLTLNEIVRHPRLPEARHAYLASFLKVYEGEPFLVRLLLEAGRFFASTARPFSRPPRIPPGARPGSPSALSSKSLPCLAT